MDAKENAVSFLETESSLKFVFLKRMDVQTSADFEPFLKDKLSTLQGRSVVFDLEKVDFIGSSFLRLCIMAAKESKGSLSIVNVSPILRKTFKIAGFENIAKIV